VERYTNIIFPHYNVRYISINDNIDSIREKTFNERISEPIVNMSNEFHVAQTSQKTRRCLETKRKHGEFVNNFAVYGYSKKVKFLDKEGKIKTKFLEIDGEAAQTVKLIFKLKIDGFSQQSIADELNNRKILSPLEYKKSNGSKFKTSFKQNKTALWSSVSVKRILENPIYTGTLILGKTTSRNYKDKRRFAKTPDKLDVFADMHPAIISKADFNIVQRLLEMDLWTASGKFAYPFSGVATCGTCGEKLYRDNKIGRNEAYYCCRNKACGRRAYINEKHLAEAVTAALRGHIACVIETANALDDILQTSVTAEKILLDDKRTQAAELDIEKIEKRKVRAFSANALAENERKKLLAEYDIQIKEKRDFIERLRQNTTKLLTANSENETLEHIKSFVNFSELSRAVVVSLIEKIVVIDKENLEVNFLFENETENLEIAVCNARKAVV
jgi:hypothetical protein